MDLQHRFTVPAPLDQTWAAFEDIESVAGCFPGATVTEVDGDGFKGSCKVKLGPIALVYSGAGRFVSKDRSAGTFVVEAKGKDRRGNGTAGATVTTTMSEEGASTAVEVSTDLSITGRPAQFGRGVMQDVSDKLLQQFVACLREKVGTAPRPPGDETADDTAETDGAAETDSAAAAGEGVTQLRSSSGPEQPSTAEPPTGTPVAEESGGDVAGPRKTPSTAYAGASAGGAPGTGAASPTTPEPPAAPTTAPAGQQDALDLGSTLLPVLLRSYGKQAAAGLALLLLGWLLGRRSR